MAGDKDPLGLPMVKSYLRITQPDQDAVIQSLIDAGVERAERIIGQSVSGKPYVKYIRDDLVSTIRLPSDDVDYTLEKHEGGAWRHQRAEKIGDTLCLPCDCSCSCDCSGCEGAPRLRLTIKNNPCRGSKLAAVTDFVWQYVAYKFQNRGTADTAAMRDIERILRPHRKIAYA